MKTKLKEITINKAHELYGNPLPKEIQERMELELNWIMEHDADIVYLLVKELVKKANEKGYLVGYRGNIGSSYIAYILGITKINPLPKQYEGFNIMFENDSGVLIKKSNSSEVKQELILNENIEAPINKNDVLGTMNYYINDNLVSSVNLVAENEISKKTLFNTFNYISSNWINLFRK